LRAAPFLKAWRFLPLALIEFYYTENFAGSKQVVKATYLIFKKNGYILAENIFRELVIMIWIFDLAWLLFLLMVFIYFCHVRSKIRQLLDWHKTSGKITACEWSYEGHRLWPKIEYNYKVNDIEYTGEHLFFDTAHNDPNSLYARTIAYKVADAYKNDKELDVYYDLQHPENAVLDRTIPRKINLIIIFIAGLIALHLVISC